MARLFILQFIAGIIGGIIAATKGRRVLLWAMLCFFFPLLTIAISLLPSLKTGAAAIRCPNCQRPINPKDNICRHCKHQKPVELVQCTGCGSYIPAGEKCSTCSREKQGPA